MENINKRLGNFMSISEQLGYGPLEIFAYINFDKV